MAELRLIVDPPNSGDWNMAADEVLLRTAHETDQVTLRFYQWSEPTLSLGYFQQHAERSAHSASTNCPLIRRGSGGGAIIHDHELTYSLTVPIRDRWSQTAEGLYTTVHNSLIELLNSRNIFCERHKGEPRKEAFLCFQRRAAGDVLLHDRKVLGSAQRRTKHGLLQHGSLLLRKSAAAPELPGLAELSGHFLKTEEIVNNWTKLIAAHFSIGFRQAIFAAAELQQIKCLASEKYRQDTWNFRR
jgi:lipoate-protein ligase A